MKARTIHLLKQKTRCGIQVGAQSIELTFDSPYPYITGEFREIGPRILPPETKPERSASEHHMTESEQRIMKKALFASIRVAPEPNESDKRAEDLGGHEARILRRVILESPFAGDVEANIEYGRRCVRDALSRGEAPIASHLLYTQPGVLRDDVPQERKLGIDAGLSWLDDAQAMVVYIDRGISPGMEHGIAAARAIGLPVETRSIEIIGGGDTCSTSLETYRAIAAAYRGTRAETAILELVERVEAAERSVK